MVGATGGPGSRDILQPPARQPTSLPLCSPGMSPDMAKKSSPLGSLLAKPFPACDTL